jgi:Dyp-type peroxidase family
MTVSANDQAADIQALADRGFPSLTGACYLLLRVEDAARAKPWLRGLKIASLAEARANHLAQVCQIAFTAAGLRALGVDVTPDAGFAPEFVDGLAGDERRSHRLGDEGANAPQHWQWGVAAREPHVLVMLLAADTAIDAITRQMCDAAGAAGCAVVQGQPTRTKLGREPFGFADGLSQPDFDWQGALIPGGARDRDYRNRLAMGELLLGYPNEYGFVGDYPQGGGLGRNGSYLVYRQLAQDVTGFWRWLAGRAGDDGALPLAERMVGREIDGAPLPGLAPAVIAGNDDPRNAFLFGGDPDGRTCPIGAHIRRVNPRSGDDPQGRHGFFRDVVSSLGLSGTALHDAVASARFHRLARRGRPYGPAVSPQDAMRGDTTGEECGLHFLCLNADLARQFEFVQGAWAASAKFAGLAAEQDPLLGNRLPLAGGQTSDAFSYADGGGCPRLVTGLPRFVTVRGGAYFFMPGLRGLARIVGEQPPELDADGLTESEKQAWAPLLDEADRGRIACFAAQVNAFQDDFARRGPDPDWRSQIDRGFHVKRHVVRAVRFRVMDDLPPQAMGGLFVPGAEYGGWLRISNGYSATLPDWFPDLVGFAVKLHDVPGAKLLPGETHVQTQDFLALNLPYLPADGPQDLVTVSLATGNFLTAPLVVLKGLGWRKTGKVLVWLLSWLPRRLFLRNPLHIAYSGIAPISIGELPIKFHWRPRDVGAGPPSSGPNKFRQAIAARLAMGEVRFDFLVQFFVDPARTPIDGAYAWPEAVAPMVKLGELIIPQGGPTPDAAELEARVNALGFNPWHALAAHRPVGNIQRVRGAVYQASARHRGGEPDPQL